MKPLVLTPPLADADLESLKIGDRVFITGDIYSARDTAHKRLVELLDRGQPLPFDLRGQIIYYVGPTPARLAGGGARKMSSSVSPVSAVIPPSRRQSTSIIIAMLVMPEVTGHRLFLKVWDFATTALEPRLKSRSLG